MTLSIVIVSYNVRHFLEQCLNSVFHSDCSLDGTSDTIGLEVFVVDNASVDGSAEMVREKFPTVRLIANSNNPGFAAANNQALRVCRGDIMLLLNPDTVVEQDTFRKCVSFFVSHPDCGGLGVKMVNGEGKFLKESKRGFPSPEASFYKISGLIRLFPHSRRIAAYYMGHLSDDETNPIDILPGAYLMISRPAMDKVGLLDEAYFMYGEDIDFSWRIKLAGFENYYLPSARIIHYKGESTKRGSMNYVYTFYNAMSIFVRHYFTGAGARLFSLALRAAIWARAALAWLKRIAQAAALPAADFAVAYGGFVLIKQAWAAGWAENVNYYPPQYTFLFLPLYVLLLMLCSWLCGGYDKPVRLSRICRGMAAGSVLLLIFYSLLDEGLRYSRALLLLGCCWTLLSSLGIRGLLGLLRVPGFGRQSVRRRACLIVGSPEEARRVGSLYEALGSTRIHTLHDVSPDDDRLREAILLFKADEVIFCSKDLPISQIIDHIVRLSHLPGRRVQAEYKIAPGESDFIIGANSISSAEDLYTEELRTASTPLNRRNKRLFDLFSALLLLLLSPLLFWPQRRKSRYFADCLRVLAGRKTWVGVDEKAVFGPEEALARRSAPLSPEIRQRLRLRYQRSYRLATDLQVLLKNLLSI